MIHTINTKQDFLDLKQYVSSHYGQPPKKLTKSGQYVLQWDSHESFVLNMKDYDSNLRAEVFTWTKDLEVQPKPNDALVFGKNEISHIVGCEVEDHETILYREIGGQVVEESIPNKLWLIGSRQFDNSWKRLDGNLTYKFIKYYNTKKEFFQDRKRYNPESTWSVGDMKEASMLLNGFTYFKGMKVKDVSILSFDLETAGLVHNSSAQILLISNTFRKGETFVRKLFAIDDFKSEAEMLLSWCNWVQGLNPAIVSGFNIYGFDFPYLNFRAQVLGIELNLGRNGSPLTFSKRTSKFRKDGSQDYDYTRCFIYGREIVDMMFVSYHYDIGRKYEKYALKSIVEQEGMTRPGRQFYESGSIAANWYNLEERAKIKIYAEDDADDVIKLWDLMMPSYFYLNQNVPKSCQAVNYSATGSIVNSFLVRSYLQIGHSLPKSDVAEKFEGAISDGYPGLYSNVFKVDVASLYPSIILQYEIYNKKKDPNAHFLKMVEFFTKARLENKKKAEETGDGYYNDLSEAGKTFINSAYGLLGTNHLLFNSPADGALVTDYGRQILKKAVLWASGQEYIPSS